MAENILLKTERNSKQIQRNKISKEISRIEQLTKTARFQLLGY